MNATLRDESHHDFLMVSDFDGISITDTTKKYSIDTVTKLQKRKTFNFKRKPSNRNSIVSIASEISDPIDVERQIHVYQNEETGALEGLPLSWIRAIQSDCHSQEIKCVYEVHPIDKTFNERMRRKNEQLKRTSVNTYQRLKNWFTRKSQEDIPSFPTSFHHTVHVTRNSLTGELEGLPNDWLQAMTL